jgi:hypothetical protein
VVAGKSWVGPPETTTARRPICRDLLVGIVRR